MLTKTAKFKECRLLGPEKQFILTLERALYFSHEHNKTTICKLY